MFPEKAEEFVDWFITPITEREHRTQKEWAEANGLAPNTVSSWKDQRWWLPLLEQRSGSKFGFQHHHDQIVVEALFRKAATGDMAAIKAWMDFRALGSLKPTEGDVSGLSDNELAQRRAQAQARQAAAG